MTTTRPQPIPARTTEIDGVTIAYREAGPQDAPTIVLLHGFPGSSATFEALMRRLATQRHVIAPDYPGFGDSSDPDRTHTPYTFDLLAETVAAFLSRTAPASFALYMFDFGAPVGLRVAELLPDQVHGLIFQNANIYEAGLGPGFNGLRGYWADPSTVGPRLRELLLSADGVRGQHLAGAVTPHLIPDTTWQQAAADVASPQRQQLVLDLLADYENNLALYPHWQQWLRNYRGPVAAVWGERDPIFTADGATALRNDSPDAAITLLDAGHFAAVENPDAVATAVLEVV